MTPTTIALVTVSEAGEKGNEPQAGRGPALPVLRDSSLPPLPRSSVPACTTTVRWRSAVSSRLGFHRTGTDLRQ